MKRRNLIGKPDPIKKQETKEWLNKSKTNASQVQLKNNK